MFYLASNIVNISYRFVGLFQGRPVEWMDASGKEITLWQSVIERAGLWVEGSVPLRTAMERPSGVGE